MNVKMATYALLSPSLPRTKSLQIAKSIGNPLRTIPKPSLAATRPRTIRTHAVASLPAAAVIPALPAIYGGLSMGTLALTTLVVSGRILGISGAVKGIVNGDSSVWRYFFVAGLLAGGVVLGILSPSLIESIPKAMVPAGFLVGLGTSIGSGCTSGHGICGNARLSPRSIVSTLTFILAGAIAAAIFKTNVVFHLPSGLLPLETPSAGLFTLSQSVFIASVSLLVSVSIAAKALIKRSASYKNQGIQNNLAAVYLDRFTSAATGFLFALALGVSGMLQPSKVSGFLAFLTGTLDPALVIVLGSSLLVALPGFQLVMRSNVLKQPMCAEKFCLPTSKDIDWKLLVGAALFGAGWGMAGICPGPGIVSTAGGNLASLLFIAPMLLGMKTSGEVEAVVEGALAKRVLA